MTRKGFDKNIPDRYVSVSVKNLLKTQRAGFSEVEEFQVKNVQDSFSRAIKPKQAYHSHSLLSLVITVTMICNYYSDKTVSRSTTADLKQLRNYSSCATLFSHYFSRSQHVPEFSSSGTKNGLFRELSSDQRKRLMLWEKREKNTFLTFIFLMLC